MHWCNDLNNCSTLETNRLQNGGAVFVVVVFPLLSVGYVVLH